MYLCGACPGFVQHNFKETTCPRFVTFLTSNFPWQYLPWVAVISISFLIGDSDVTKKSRLTCPLFTLIKVPGDLGLCSSSSADNFQEFNKASIISVLLTGLPNFLTRTSLTLWRLCNISCFFSALAGISNLKVGDVFVCFLPWLKLKTQYNNSIYVLFAMDGNKWK